MIIKDPRTQDAAEVSADYHLKVTSRTFSEEDSEMLAGNAYDWSSGIMAVDGSAAANGIAYLKNTTTDATYIISNIEVHLGDSTSGTGDAILEVLRNPTTGTLISTPGTTVAPVNRDFGSAQTLTGTFLASDASGRTLTNGDTLIYERLSSNRVADGFVSLGGNGSIKIPPGGAIGVRYTTQSSNSNQDVSVTIDIYKKTLAV